MEVTINGPTMTVIGVLMSALAGVVVLLFKLLLAAKDAQIAELTTDRNIYRQAAQDAMRVAEVATNKLRKERGLPPLPLLAAVVPEHQSPPSAKQIAVAELATLRALMVVIMAELELPPRAIEPPDAAD